MRTNQISKIGSISLFILAICVYSANAQDSLKVTKVGQLYADWGFTGEGTVVAGNYAYVAAYSNGLRIINIANPAHPMEVGYYDPPGWALGVAIAGNYAYVACDQDGLRIINVSNSTNPTEVGHWDVGYYAQDVAVVGDYAYVAAYDDGLVVINVANPANPIEVWHCETPGWAYGVAVVGDYAYIADSYLGLCVIYIADPANPMVAECLLGYTIDVAATGNYAYAVSAEYGLHVVSVADPTNPTEVGYFDTPGCALGVAVAGDYVYVADGTGGLRVVNVQNPSSPIEVGYYYAPLRFACSVAVVGNYAYMQDYDYFSIYDCSIATPVNPFTEIPTPTAFSLAPPYPNPFNPTTMLTFTLPHPAKVTLEVFDINGRLVGQPSVVASAGGKQGRLPYQEMFDAGTHTISFDGSGLPSGIYLARLMAGEYQAVQKLALLK